MDTRKIKNKKFIAIAVFIFCFFVGGKIAFAATLNFNPSSGKYRVGDTIKIRVVVDSNVSINAISAKVIFPTDNLTSNQSLKIFRLLICG